LERTRRDEQRRREDDKKAIDQLQEKLKVNTLAMI
jgi:hypothetical protein